MHNRLDYSDLALILALVRGGSLSRAAERLRVDVSTVFRSIRRLEASLGSELFEKKRTGYMPTPTALLLADQAERAEHALDSARASLACAEASAGTVQLTCTESVLESLVAPALADVLPAYPQLTLEITTSDSFANLSRRDADIALRLTKIPPEHLVGRCLGEVSYVLCGQASYLDQVKDRSWDTLTWVSLDDSFNDHPTITWRQHHYPNLVPRYRCQSIHAVTQLVRSGLGVAILPHFVVQADPELYPLSPPLANCDSELWILIRADGRVLQPVHTLYRALSEAIFL
ncbi:LysR family transcriptional regulator [Pseudomonas asuensis]|uniref:LysR family transcriptional regulator n=1 Tax=Pseudomonas asuensis TaxID=1825787 RepID=A0ABQ2GUE1_9PSED|nr:LysR family transcriptional regulator [Pseudomonas asuensis]GGM12025.1 LysR family transcriptional regulator [Pseudomonas asuensis]